MCNLKSLGLALVAVLAVTAVVASAAQATPEFTASAYPSTGTGSNEAGGETFTTEAGTVRCDSHFEGQLTEADSTLKVSPTYTDCAAFGFLNAVVDTEECSYVFHATEKVEAGVYNSHVDVSCPEGQSIKISGGTCKAKIESQEGLTTVKTTNVIGDITVQPNVPNIALIVTQDGIGCAFKGIGPKTGSYHGDLVFSNTGEAAISVSGE